MSTNEDIIRRLKDARAKKNISQSTLAEWCGWTQSRIGNYESGARSIGVDDAIKLASVLGIPPAELIFGVDGGTEKILSDKHKKLIEIFNQLPVDEQDKFMTMMNVRLQEIDDFIEEYRKFRIKE